MGMKADTAEPTTDSGIAEWGCPACGHPADHIPPSKLSIWIRNALGLRPAMARCAMSDDEGPLDSMNQCDCMHIAHASGTTDYYWVEEL